MIGSGLDLNSLRGLASDEPPAPDTENRTFGTLLKDEAARAAAVPVGWARSLTNAARSGVEKYTGGDEPISRNIDQGVAAAQKWLEEVPSARSKAIDENKWNPQYGERSAWNEPVTTILHGVAPLVPYLGAGRLAKTGAELGQAAGTVSFAAMGAGEAAQKVRDFADTTPIEELKKLEPFQDLMREYSGNEQAARTALYHKSIDTVSLLTNAGANVLSFGALQHALAGAGASQKPLIGVLMRALGGGVEGATVGAATSGASAYGEQRMKVDTGQQGAIDIGPIAHQMVEGAAGMGPLMAALHIGRGEGSSRVVRTKDNTEPGVVDALDQQLNPPNAGGQPSPPPPGSPPGAAEAGAPAGPPPTGPAGAGPGGGGPPAAAAAVPTGAAIDTGQPPAAAQVQPQVTVTPPPGRKRAAPVTPAPTEGAPAEGAPAEGAPTQATYNGETVTVVGAPTERGGGTWQRILKADGSRDIVPVGDLQPAGAPAAPAAPAARQARAKAVTPEVVEATTAPEVQDRAPVGPATWASGDYDYPVTVLDKPAEQGPDGRWYQPVKAHDGQETYVPLDELKPATVPAPKPAGKGKAKVEEVAAKNAAAAEPVPAAPAPAPPAPVEPAPVVLAKPKAVKTRRAAAKSEAAKATDPALKQALTFAHNPHSTLEDLASAADYGRTNNRPDIVHLASDRAEEVARNAETRTSPYPETDKAHAESRAQLAMTAKETRRQAEEVKRGRGTETPHAPPEGERQEQDQKETSSPHQESNAQKVTTEVSAEPVVERKPKPEAPVRRTKSKTAELNTGDVVQYRNKKQVGTYTVRNVQERPEYPHDPIITVEYAGNPHEHFQHKASALDRLNPVEHIISHGAEPSRTRSGRRRAKTEHPAQITVKEPVKTSLSPPVAYPGYKYIGKNAQGHEVWQDPTSPHYRVTRRIEKNEKGKPKGTVVVKEEVPKLARDTNQEYVRPQHFYVKGEKQPPLRPVLVREHVNEPEETDRAPGQFEARRRKITEEQEGIDTDVSTIKHRLRNVAAKEQGEAAVRVPFTPLEGGPRVPLSLRKTRPVYEKTGEKTYPDDDEGAKIDAAVQQLKSDAEHGVLTEYQSQGEIGEFRGLKENAAGLKSTGIYETNTTGGHVQTRAGTPERVHAPERKEMTKTQLDQRIKDLSMRMARHELSLDVGSRERLYPDIHEVEQLARGFARDLHADMPERLKDVGGDHNYQLQTLERYKDLSRENFFSHEAVNKALERIRELNAERAREGREPMLVPDWLSQKMRANPEKGSLIDNKPYVESLTQRLYGRVSRLAADERANPERARSPEMQARISRIKELWSRLQEHYQRETRKNIAEPLMDDELRGKIAEIFRKGHYLGTVEDYIKKANDLLATKREVQGGTKRNQDARLRMKQGREGVAEFAVADTLHDFFKGDAKKVEDFLNSFVGLIEVHKSVDPKTNESISVYRPAKFPEPPEYITQIKKAGGTGTEAVAFEQRKGKTRFQRETEAYEKRVAKWVEATNAKFAAADDLRKVLEGVLARYKLEINNFKKTRGYSTESRSINWDLPKGPHFRAHNADEGFDYYNFVNSLQKVLNKLQVEHRALTNGELNNSRVRNPELETRRYMQRLSTTLHNFAFDMKNFINGDMEAIRTSNAERNLGITHGFNIADRSVRGEDGEHVSMGEAALERDTSHSVTDLNDLQDLERDIIDRIYGRDTEDRRTEGRILSGRRAEDVIINKVARDQKVDLNAENIRDKARGANQTAAERAAEKTAQLRKDFPLRSDMVRYRGKLNMDFDAEGLPTNGKKWVEFEPYERDHIDEAFDALNSGDPTHPLIEAPTSSQTVVDTIKDMIRKGEQGATISKAITPKFLDQLARITKGTEVVHAPYEAVSAAGQDAPAYYLAEHDRVVLSNNATNDYYTRAGVHELVHAATSHLLESDPQFHAEVETQLGKAQDAAKRAGIVPRDYNFTFRYSDSEGAVKLPRHLYGLTNVQEFLAEAKSNEKFRQFLARVNSGQSTIGDKIKNVINSLYKSIQTAFRKVMGHTDADTALDTLFYDQSNVLGKTDAIVSRNFKRLERTGRDTSVSVDKFGLDHPARGTEHAAESAASNLRGYVGRSAHEALDRAKHLRDNKGAGLGLHTMFDLGRRTNDPEFQQHVKDVVQLRGQEDHEQRRILQEEDSPIIENAGTYLRGLSSKTREKVAKALIMETEHRAYLDAPLGEKDADGKLAGRNAHIDPDDPAWTQTAAEHEWLRKNVFDPVAKIPGFMAMRKQVHDFYKGREKELRSALVRTLSEANGLLPKGLSAADHTHVLDTLEKHMLGKAGIATMTDAEKATFGKHFNFKEDSPEDKVFKEKVADIKRIARQYSHVEGPYIPLVRHGEFSVHGKFILPEAKNGEVIMQKDRRPGPKENELVDNGIRSFKSAADMREYVKKVTKELGIAQIDGGIWHYDPATGERVMQYTPDELKAVNEKRLAGGEKPVKNRLAGADQIKEMRDQGRPIDSRHWIQFSPHLLERHATRTAARESIAQWVKTHGPDKLQISGVELSRKGEGRASEQHVSDTLQKVINQFKASEPYTNMDQFQRADISERLGFLAQKAVMHRGVRQRYLPRRYVRGASENIVRALTDYSGSTAAWLAKMRYAPRITSAWEKFNDYVGSKQYEHGDRDSEARATIRDYLGTRLHQPSDPVASSMFSRGADRLIRWTMLDKLPGIAYFVTNGSEPIVLAAPLQMGRHGVFNVINTMREAYSLFGPLRMIGGGVADVARAAMGGKVRRNYQIEFEQRVKGHPNAPGLLELIKYMKVNGLYDEHTSMEYQKQAPRAESGVWGAADKLSDYLTNIFQAGNVSIENLNRIVTGASSYLLEVRRLEKLGDPDASAKAMQYAWEIAHKANGVYNNYNAPAWFNKTPLHRLMFEFKKYPQRIIANHIDNFVGMIHGDKEKARALVASLVMQGAVAGMLGLPTEVFSIPVNGLYMAGLTNQNWDDYMAGFREWSAAEFGKEGGEMLSYGFLRASGIDFQSRLTQNSMLAFGSPQSTKMSDARSAAFSLIMGAGGQEAFDLITAIQKGAASKHAYDSGNPALGWQLALESARLGMPFRAATDIIEANMQGDEAGVQTQSGRPRSTPLTAGEQLIRAGGFTPTRISNQQEQSRTVRRIQKRQQDEKTQFTNEFVNHADIASKQRVWARVQDWNKDKPDDQKLTYDQLTRAAATRGKAEQQSPDYAGIALDRRTKSIASGLHAF